MKKTLIRPTSLFPNSSTPLVSPIIQSNVYVTKDPSTLDKIYNGELNGYTYAREKHPNAEILARRINILENSKNGFITSSGMSAISAVLFSLCRSGEHVIAGDQLYGRTSRLLQEDLPRLGIKTTFVDTTDYKKVQESITKKTRIVIIELISNPTLRISDIVNISKICKKNKILLVVDNTFTTPLSIKPLDLGADIIIHSITKLLSGHSDVTLGYFSTNHSKIFNRIYDYAVTTGLTPSPFECWLAERGLNTFEIRFHKCQENAEKLAVWLQKRPEVINVIYPKLNNHPDKKIFKTLFNGNSCNMVSFELRGNRSVANKFAKNANQISFAPTLGDVGTTLSHPASSSHRSLSKAQRKKMGITEGFFRVSVGLEDIEDLKNEFKKGLKDLQ